MKTQEEYRAILDYTVKRVDEYFPNWRIIQSKENFASMFARCMPPNMTYEDIAIVCFLFHANKKE